MFNGAMDRRRLLALTGGAMLVHSAGFVVSSASGADLSGDIAILREALTLHPGLYR
jgi:hypothetical protein